MEDNGRGFVAGLAVALLGGGAVIGLLVALFALSNDSGKTTVTKTVTAAAAPEATGATTTSEGAGTVPATLAADVVAGAYTFNRYGCGACHGPNGEGGVNPAIPGLVEAPAEFSAAQMRDIIDKGAGVVADPKAPFMPVWGAVISDRQVDELVAYIQAGLPAVPGAEPEAVPDGATPESAGGILYSSLGCINCHGPNGLGGVPNPSSPDKSIPPLAGADFAGEFDTPEKISQMIREGSVLGGPAIVSMPHWGGVLTDDQINALVAYIQSLK